MTIIELFVFAAKLAKKYLQKSFPSEVGSYSLVGKGTRLLRIFTFDPRPRSSPGLRRFFNNRGSGAHSR